MCKVLADLLDVKLLRKNFERIGPMVFAIVCNPGEGEDNIPTICDSTLYPVGEKELGLEVWTLLEGNILLVFPNGSPMDMDGDNNQDERGRPLF